MMVGLNNQSVLLGKQKAPDKMVNLKTLIIMCRKVISGACV